MLRFLLANVLLLVGWLQPSPTSTEPISIDNVDRIEQLNQIGSGTIYQLDWFDSEDQIFIATSTGIWTYDNVRAETNASPTLLANPTDGDISDFSYFNGITTIAIETTGRNQWDRNVVVFHSDTQASRLIDDEEGYFEDAILSPDGLLLAVMRYLTPSYHVVIHIWNTRTTSLMQTIELGRIDFLDYETIEFSLDGNLIATATENDGRVRVWNVQTGAELLNIESRGTKSLAFSPDNRYLATAGASFAPLTLWDIDTAQEIFSVQTHDDIIFDIAFSPTGEFLATSNNWNNTLRVWSASNGEEIATLPVDTGLVSFNQNGETLASVGSDNVIRIWDVETWTEIKTLADLIPPVAEVAFSPVDETIAIGGAGALLQIWDTQTVTPLMAFQISLGEYSTGRVYDVAFSPDGTRLFAAIDYDGVQYWNLPDTSEPVFIDACCYPIVFSPDGNMVAFGTEFVNVENFEVIQTLQYAEDDYDRSANDLAFSPDGSIVATASGEHNLIGIDPMAHMEPRGTFRLRLWDIATGEEIALLDEADIAVGAVVFSPDGSLLASGYDDGVIKLWDVATRTQLARLASHTHWITTLAFNVDGSLLVSGSYDETIRLWDVTTMTEVGVLEEHTDIVTDLAFNSAGTLMASAGWDGTVRLWGVR